jgi:hypothetical protein
MKTTNYILIALIIFNFNAFSQLPNEIEEDNKGSFVGYTLKNNLNDLNNWNNLFPEKEEIKDKTIPIMISSDFVNKVLENKEESMSISIPFYNDNKIELTLIKKDFDLNSFQLIVRTEEGEIAQQYNPGFLAYQIDNSEFDGIMIFSKSGVNAVLHNSHFTYELAKLDDKRAQNFSNDLYILSDISDNPNHNHFTCGVDHLDNVDTDHIHDIQSANRLGSSLSCMNIAIEIDYFTRQTFASISESIDWALSILAGVSLIYEEELNLKLSSNYAYVWDTNDPYNDYIDQSSEMLYAIKDKWNEDEDLTNIERHMVHLFTKRQDTGTGGIAFVNGAGNDNYGFGFSSNLTSDMEYAEVPSPFFHWNLLCTAHELGHNLGSMHTQWCGWEGGPINNCVDLEESTPGECDSYINNPTPEIGTIMSYCHTWNQNQGGGITMKFDPLVQEVILAKASTLNLPICEEQSVDIIYGCLDDMACNFNNLATQEDDTCIYADIYYDCDGNCILDQDEDGVCDELDNCPEHWNTDQIDTNEDGVGDRCEYLLPLEEMENLNVLMAYPNPTTGLVNITYNTDQAKDISLEVYNILGDRIACGYPDLLGKEVTVLLDLSDQPKGFYSIIVKTQNNISSERIIIK